MGPDSYGGASRTTVDGLGPRMHGRKRGSCRNSVLGNDAVQFVRRVGVVDTVLCDVTLCTDIDDGMYVLRAA